MQPTSRVVFFCWGVGLIVVSPKKARKERSANSGRMFLDSFIAELIVRIGVSELTRTIMVVANSVAFFKGWSLAERFFRGFSFLGRRIFSPIFENRRIFVGKSAHRNPPGESLVKSSKSYTTKIPNTFLQKGHASMCDSSQEVPATSHVNRDQGRGLLKKGPHQVHSYPETLLSGVIIKVSVQLTCGSREKRTKNNTIP